MGKTFRKTDTCSNCNASLSNANYCPECGQQNTTKNVGIGILVKDFIDDFFTLDSRLFKTIFPLLFKPGFLTLEYNKGKRIKYLPPLRMYLVLSILIFLIPSKNTDNISQSSSKDHNAELKKNLANVDSYETLGSSSIDSITRLEFGSDTFLFNSKSVQTNEIYKDSVVDVLWVYMKDDSFVSFLGEKAVKNWMTNALSIYQSGNTQDVFLDYLASKLPNMMFVMLPLFALLLMLFFRKHNILYVETLVFSLHFHSFYFFSICVAKLLLLFLSSGLVAFFLNLLLPFVYLILALKKIYEQSYKRIVVKSIVMLSIYGVLLFIGTVVLFLLLLF